MINIKKKHVLDIYKSMDLVFKTAPTIKYMDILTTSQLPPISYHPCLSEVLWGSCPHLPIKIYQACFLSLKCFTFTSLAPASKMAGKGFGHRSWWAESYPQDPKVKERTNVHKLPSDLHMPIVIPVHRQTTHKHKIRLNMINKIIIKNF